MLFFKTITEDLQIRTLFRLDKKVQELTELKMRVHTA